MQRPDFFNFLNDNPTSQHSSSFYTSQDDKPESNITPNKGIDFRRRKNWSERILVEITGLLHVLSPNGNILYCSESTYDLTGYRPHELVGQFLIDFLHVDDIDIFIRDFQISFHTRSQIKTHFRFRKKDDNYVIFEVVGHPKADMPGQPPQAFFGIAQPVPSKSGAMMDTFLELKAENNWLKKRIEELSAKYPKEESKLPTNNHNNTFIITTHQRLIQSQKLQQNEMVPGLLNISPVNISNNPPSQDIYQDKKDTWSSNHLCEIKDLIPDFVKEEKPDFIPGPPTDTAERKRKKKFKNADEFVCADCGTTNSPEWRKGPHGPKTLCNACGLRWAKRNKKKDSNDD